MVVSADVTTIVIKEGSGLVMFSSKKIKSALKIEGGYGHFDGEGSRLVRPTLPGR